jgi:hypothetical protein
MTVDRPVTPKIEIDPVKRFYETLANSHENSVGCVDGRKAEEDGIKKWVKMLGGSLHPVYIRVLHNNEKLDRSAVNSTFDLLRAHDRRLGVHRGSHKNEEENVSDCGAGDRIVDILNKVKEKKDEIKSRITELVIELSEAEPEAFNRLLEIMNLPGNIGLDRLAAELERVINKITAYDTENVELKGEALIATAIEHGAETMNLQNKHAENRAMINMKDKVTFDTVMAVDKNDDAFDLDLAEAVEQSVEAGVNDKVFATLGSIILYAATEMVLVEDKGKEALPVYFHH